MENLSIVPRFVVPRLEHLAFTVSYEEILGNLALCLDHWPKKMQQMGGKIAKYASRLSPEIGHSFTSEDLITFVRNRLDYHLVGLMGDKIRKKYVEKFYKTCPNLEENTIDPWAFFECVLDESFKELETHAALPGAEPNLKVISTIANCSSGLEKLTIDFSLMKTSWLYILDPLISSLSSLKNLTSLNLHKLHDSNRWVVKLVGTSCPLLTHLSISGFYFSEKDVFALILGRFSDELLWVNKDVLWSEGDLSFELLEAPSEILSGFCCTLRHLKLSFGEEQMYTDRFQSLATFILRHLPSLEKMDGHHISSGVVKMSTASSNQDPRRRLINADITEHFENARKELAARNHGTVLVNRPTFSGSLSLISLDCVYLNSDMLRAIPKFCPQLKEVTFRMASSQRSSNYGLFDLRKRNSLPNEVQEHLKEWPKLETITLENIPSEYAKVILKAFGSSLKSVTFKSCRKINLMDLLPCSLLEKLSILICLRMETPPEIEPGRPSSEFLPALKSFQSDYCLGLWSLWLEQKSQLTHVALNCCHFGTNASAFHDFSSVPKMWPKLESFRLRQCDGPIMSTVSNFIPQLLKLKELQLPVTMAKSDRILAAQMSEDLKYHPSPVHICIGHFYPVLHCSLTIDSEDSDI